MSITSYFPLQCHKTLFLRATYRIEVAQVLLLVFVEFEVRDGLFEAAGAGEAGVAEDTAGTLGDVSFESDFF